MLTIVKPTLDVKCLVWCTVHDQGVLRIYWVLYNGGTQMRTHDHQCSKVLRIFMQPTQTIKLMWIWSFNCTVTINFLFFISGVIRTYVRPSAFNSYVSICFLWPWIGNWHWQRAVKLSPGKGFLGFFSTAVKPVGEALWAITLLQRFVQSMLPMASFTKQDLFLTNTAAEALLLFHHW